MASLHAILLLMTALYPSFSHVLGSDDSKVLEWPEEYHIKGETTNLFTGIIKPFEAWYSGRTNMSRVDYYGGTVKTYYIGENDEDYGKKYMIYPVTTEDMTNEIVCVAEQDKGELVKVLESSENFIYSGKEVYNNQEVDIWKLVETDDEDYIVKKREVTFYVYLDENGNNIPVLRENVTHNFWTGGIERHVITRFFDFKEFDPEDLDVTHVEACNKTLTEGPVHQEKLQEIHHPVDADAPFYGFKMQHNKKYRPEEHEKRKQIFQEKLRRVIEHNQKNLGYKLTINKFSDLTDDELSYLFGTRPSDRKELGSVVFPYTDEEIEEIAEDLPENYDMRVEGFISSVKNQARCGSCWAFATTATVEGALARSNGARNIDLSEQSLVDCAWGFGNMGCEGGFLDDVFKYVLKHGIPMEEYYGPYLEANGLCKITNMTEIYRIKGYARVPALSVNAMKLALYKYGPVTVGINATPIKDYSSGIFYDPECNDGGSNHAVTVVGYGVRDGTSYWIVKNSWGEDWGQDGYILFSANNNNCHLLENSYFPIV